MRVLLLALSLFATVSSVRAVAPAKPLPVQGLLELPIILNDTTVTIQIGSPAESASTEFLLLENLVSYAKNYLGVPYRSGGRSGKGFDCSGFTSYVFSQFGFSLPRTSYAQAVAGKAVNTDEIRKGDLIFFKGRNAKSRAVGHVGIVISDKGEKIRFIHASVNRGISIETIDSKYYKPRFVKSVRLVDTVLPAPENCEVAAAPCE